MKLCVTYLLTLTCAAAAAAVKKDPFRSQRAPSDTIVQYDVVSPVITREEGGGTYPIKLEIEILVTDETTKLSLELNHNLIPPNFQCMHYDEVGREIITKGFENCYYQGAVEDHPDWIVTMSTCQGLQGSFGDVKDRGHYYHLEPLDSSNTSLEQLHAIYLDSEYQHPEESFCGSGHSAQDLLHAPERVNMTELHERVRRQTNTTFYVELVIVNDHAIYTAYNRSFPNTVKRAIDMANVADNLYRPLNVRIALVAVITWTRGDRIIFTPDPELLIDRFRLNRLEFARFVSHDAAMLITGRELNESVGGIAYLGGMCSFSEVGVVVDISYSLDFVGAVLAHEVGHLFSMEHDSRQNCTCDDPTSVCIMSATTVINSPLSTWSSCSREDLNAGLFGQPYDLQRCLRDEPAGVVRLNYCVPSNGGCEHICTNTSDANRCSCRPGYRLATDGRSCYALLCPDPVSIANGGVTFTGNSVGNTSTYTCDVGFELIGDATTICTQVDANSAAFQPAPPDCRPLCPDPVDIVNGMVTFTGNSAGDTATYTCNSGFELIGDAMTTCTQVDANSAAFQPAIPICRQLLCLSPVGIVNGGVTFTGNSVGDTATYTCNSGFELIGDAMTTCAQVDANSAAFQPGPPDCRQPLSVSISVNYIRRPADFSGGPDEYRAASGPVRVTCTASGGGSGTISYQWSSTCRNCPFRSATSSSIIRAAVHSGDTGTHTCVATRGGDTVMASINFRVVDAGVHIFRGTPRGNFPLNNGLVISDNPAGNDFRFRIICRSDSVSRNVGQFIGLDGTTSLTSNSYFSIAHRLPGEMSVESTVGFQNALSVSQQGVYTCRTPLQNGVIKEFNIGIYPNGFDVAPRVMSLTAESSLSSSTLNCTTTDSPATNVTWTRNGQPLTIDGNTYRLVQTVTSRAASTYENVLTVIEHYGSIVGATFTCRVENALGSDTSHGVQVPALCPDPVDIVNGMVTFTGNSAGDTATYTCDSGFELIGDAMTTCTPVDANSAAFEPTVPVCRLTLPANCSGLLGSFNCDSDGLCAYTASYEVQQDNSITFIVSARTSPFSWVGIGVSDDQRMPNSDIVLGAALSDNTTSFIHDRYVFSQTEPPIDDSQDIERASAEHVDGVTTITFNRPRNSGDTRDISLDECRFFLFAYGGLVNFWAAPPIATYHGPTHRTTSAERICIPTFTECLLK